MQELIKDLKKYYSNENSGHDFSHTLRVYDLARSFAKELKADLEIVSLAALLHDCDDYKLVGIEEAKELKNTRYFLSKYNYNDEVVKKVITIIQTMGYSNYLNGIRCKELEGMIVSDADMCDSIGSHGILRSYQYNTSHNREFFNSDIFPQLNQTKEEYQNKNNGTSVTHFFEKLFLIKKCMLTEPGKKEANNRFKIMLDFLKQYFIEENQIKWIDYLDRYLKENELI